MSDAEAALLALQARLRACRRCAFAHAVTPVVAGSSRSRILLVGQAPGKSEQQGGRPWNGPAGKRLTRWMTEVVGFENEASFRSQVYLAAVTRCFPGAHPSGHGDRKPGPAEIAACADWLGEEIALLRPRAIVLVGSLAIERFMGPVRLDAVIGRAFPMAFEGFEARLYPLPHPSGASTWLNVPAHQAMLTEGLGLLRTDALANEWATLKQG